MGSELIKHVPSHSWDLLEGSEWAATSQASPWSSYPTFPGRPQQLPKDCHPEAKTKPALHYETGSFLPVETFLCCEVMLNSKKPSPHAWACSLQVTGPFHLTCGVQGERTRKRL